MPYCNVITNQLSFILEILITNSYQFYLNFLLQTATTAIEIPYYRQLQFLLELLITSTCDFIRIPYFQKVIQYPNATSGKSEFYLAMCFIPLNNNKEACTALNSAKKKGYPGVDEYISKYCK